MIGYFAVTFFLLNLFWAISILASLFISNSHSWSLVITIFVDVAWITFGLYWSLCLYSLWVELTSKQGDPYEGLEASTSELLMCLDNFLYKRCYKLHAL